MYQFGRDFEPGDVRFQNFTSVCSESLSQRERRRNDRSCWLAHYRKAMIVIEGVGRRPVGKRGVQRRCLKSLSYDARFLSGRLLARNFGGDAGIFFLAARERHAKTVTNGKLCGFDGVGRYALVIKLHDKFG